VRTSSPRSARKRSALNTTTSSIERSGSSMFFGRDRGFFALIEGLDGAIARRRVSVHGRSLRGREQSSRVLPGAARGSLSLPVG